jgi:hypothetical protein
MTPAERELALQGLDDSRERLLGAMRGLSREQFHYRTAPERWSVAECVEHIILVETFLLGRLQALLQQAPDSAKRSAWEGRDGPLMKKVAEDRVSRFQAPEIFRPTGRWPIEKLAPEFEGARALSRNFAASVQGDLRCRFFPHPLFGDLDCYQWILLLASHCDRHRAQGEEVMASPGFPRRTTANL